MKKYITIVLIVLFFTSCTTIIQLDPLPGTVKTSKYGGTIFIDMDKKTLLREYVATNHGVLGRYTRWIIPLGDGLQKSSQSALSRIFSNVIMIDSDTINDTLPGIVFKADILQFSISHTLETKLKIRTHVYNDGILIFTEDYIGEKGHFISCISGALRAETTLTNSVNYVFEDAFTQLLKALDHSINFDNLKEKSLIQ